MLIGHLHHEESHNRDDTSLRSIPEWRAKYAEFRDARTREKVQYNQELTGTPKALTSVGDCCPPILRENGIAQNLNCEFPRFLKHTTKTVHVGIIKILLSRKQKASLSQHSVLGRAVVGFVNFNAHLGV